MCNQERGEGGAGGGYNISEQQLFEALKMNYTGDSFICLRIHFFIKSSEDVKKRTCHGNNSSEQLNRAWSHSTLQKRPQLDFSQLNMYIEHKNLQQQVIIGFVVVDPNANLLQSQVSCECSRD